MLDKMKQLGIEPGKPFAISDPATAKSLDEGVQDGASTRSPRPPRA